MLEAQELMILTEYVKKKERLFLHIRKRKKEYQKVRSEQFCEQSIQIFANNCT